MQRNFVCSILHYIFTLYIAIYIYLNMFDLHLNNAIAKIPQIALLLCTCD